MSDNKSDKKRLIGRAYYCTACKEIVGNRPLEHRANEHDGDHLTGIHLIEDRDTDDRLIAVPSGMGHFTPHIWTDVDGQDMCAECGAVRISDSVVNDYLNSST